MRSGLAVHKLRGSGSQTGGLSPALHVSNSGMGISTYFCTQPSGTFTPIVSTVKLSFSPLFSGYFSPLSTGPIETITKYISNIGVSS